MYKCIYPLHPRNLWPTRRIGFCFALKTMFGFLLILFVSFRKSEYRIHGACTLMPMAFMKRFPHVRACFLDRTFSCNCYFFCVQTTCLKKLHAWACVDTVAVILMNYHQLRSDTYHVYVLFCVRALGGVLAICVNTVFVCDVTLCNVC